MRTKRGAYYIAPGRGHAIYEAMVCQRKNGRVWGIADFSEAVGVSRNTPAKWFAGVDLDRKSLLAIAQATGVNPETLEAGDVMGVRRSLLGRLTKI